MALGYKVHPGFFLKEIVQYPLVILLSVLLPVSFWLKVQAGKKSFALLFLGIFFINASLLIFALEQNYSSKRILDSNAEKGIAQIAEILSRDENIQKRELAARYIYQHHAVPMAFKTTGNNFVLYAPSEVDKERYRSNFARNAEIGTARMNSIEQLLTTFFLLILHAGLFLCLILFLVIFDQKDSSQ